MVKGDPGVEVTCKSFADYHNFRNAIIYLFNTLRPGQDVRYFAENILESIYSKENFRKSYQDSNITAVFPQESSSK